MLLPNAPQYVFAESLYDTGRLRDFHCLALQLAAGGALISRSPGDQIVDMSLSRPLFSSRLLSLSVHGLLCRSLVAVSLCLAVGSAATSYGCTLPTCQCGVSSLTRPCRWGRCRRYMSVWCVPLLTRPCRWGRCRRYVSVRCVPVDPSLPLGSL